MAPARDASAIDPPFRRVAIAGVGLIGGSIALAARAAWPAVTILGLDRGDAAADAKARGVIHEARSRIADVGDADLIVLAAPIEANLQLLEKAAAARLGGLVTDTSSTKRGILDVAARAGLTRFIGGHPVAGAERGGIGHARADLFVDRPWALMRTPNLEDEARQLEAFVRGLGARPAVMDAPTHDRLMAYVSHVPQLLAVALMNTAGRECGDAAMATAGRAFREMTRLAESSEELWRGIVGSNADFIAEALAALARELPAAGSGLADGGWTRQAFPPAREWRARLNAFGPPS
jgi:prephenate dehydrogenase